MDGADKDATASGCGISRSPVPLGWAGWWTPTPAAWSFFELDGGYAKGVLMLGDAERPRLELSWAWSTRRNLNAEAYARRFLLRGYPWKERKQAAGEMRSIELPHFGTGMVVEERNRTLGVAYAPRTNRFLHWVYHHGSSQEDRRFHRDVLPLWRDQTLDAPSQWAFYGHGFLVPEGFRLQRATLNMGDMELLLVDPLPWKARHRLCIRLIYPATLALSRQPMAKWLRELFRKRAPAYRAVGGSKRQPLAFQHALAPGFLLKARLQFLLRFPLRPFAFRLAPCVVAGIHHLEKTNKLLYLQVAASPERIESAAEHILNSLTLTPENGS